MVVQWWVVEKFEKCGREGQRMVGARCRSKFKEWDGGGQWPSKQAGDKIDFLICAWICHEEDVERKKVLMPCQESFKRCLSPPHRCRRVDFCHLPRGLICKVRDSAIKGRSLSCMLLSGKIVKRLSGWDRGALQGGTKATEIVVICSGWRVRKRQKMLLIKGFAEMSYFFVFLPLRDARIIGNLWERGM